jgi:hypothetical protein
MQKRDIRAEAEDVSESRVEAMFGETQELPRLTREEDDELRRLHWISQIGALSHHKRERMVELRLRDRRQEIRAPREFAEEKVEIRGGKKRKWYQFRSQ